MAKSAAFGTVHLGIAFVVCYALTGDFLAASLFTMVEPACNTVAHKFFDDWWTRSGRQSLWAKAALFGTLHVAVAFAVCWALTGNVLAASLQIVIEPACNMVALVLFDRWWDSERGRTLRAGFAMRMQAVA